MAGVITLVALIALSLSVGIAPAAGQTPQSGQPQPQPQPSKPVLDKRLRSFWVTATGGLNLLVRSQPTRRSTVLGHIGPYARLNIYCQAAGERISLPWNRYGSNVWDKTLVSVLGGPPIPGYVFDVYVDSEGDFHADTPGRGPGIKPGNMFTPGIPRC